MPISTQLRSVSLWLPNISRLELERLRQQLTALADALAEQAREIAQWAAVLDDDTVQETVVPTLTTIASNLEIPDLKAISGSLIGVSRDETDRAHLTLPRLADAIDERASELHRCSQELTNAGFNIAGPAISLIASTLGVIRH